MKNKLFSAFLCLLIIAAVTVGGFYAAAKSNTVGEVQSLIDGIVAFNINKTGENSVREWIDGTLTAEAGLTSEWYIIALKQSGTEYDFTEYAEALSVYLDNKKITGAVTRQKYALALIAAGRSENPFVAEALNDSIGEQGVMSWIFGLHLINNSSYTAEYTAREITETLLSLSLADGGWAVTGSVSDVDVTAMAVQALALYYDTDNDVKAAVDKALIFLSEKQLDGGDYSGYGTPNPESTSQVIIALASLGIDPVEDSRFIKNGNGLIDGLLKYRLPDGSFSHTENGAFNHTSTVQAFYSLVVLKRYFSGYDAFYTLDKTQNGSDDVSEPSETPSQAEASDSHAISSDESEHISVSVDISAELSVPDATDTTNYKIWASLSVSAVLIIICFVLWLMKKRRIKNYILPIMLGIIAVLIIILTDFQSKGDYYGDTASKTDVIGTVTLTVRCDTIAAEGNAEYIPSDGVILPVTIFDIANGDSVYDILIEAARKYGIQVENKGSKAAGMVYISAIGYIYEYDFGDLAGWMYRVNGVFPSTDCGGYILSDGDIIEWLYTKNLGDDLK